MAPRHQNELSIKAKYSPVMTAFLVIIIGGLLTIDYCIRSTLVLPPIKISKQDSAVNFDDTMLSIFNLGQKRLIASLLWAETLIDSDIEHYKKNDLNSWLYLRFKTIVSIDPLFKEAYRYGGQYLSTIKDDIVGAEELYRRGLKIFPNDFFLNYYAGFNYFYEMGDFEKAKECYARIYHHPYARQIIFFDTLYARIASNSGDLPTAFEVIKTLYDQAPKDSPLKKDYGEMLYNIKAEIDLNCLNGIDEDLSLHPDKQAQPVKKKKKKINPATCAHYDFDGKPYIRRSDGTYVAPKPWTPHRIRKTRKENFEQKEKATAPDPVNQPANVHHLSSRTHADTGPTRR